MRQLIARIDDELHVRLKERAAAEGRSLNSLVTDLLEHGVDDESPQTRLRRRMEALGLLAKVPPPSGRVPSHEEVFAMMRGDAGRAVIEALEADRKHR